MNSRKSKPPPAIAYQSAAYFDALVSEARGLLPVTGTADICDSWLSPLPEPQQEAGHGLAILHDPDDPHSPSDARSNRYFRKLARRHGIETTIIGPGNLADLPRFGALWIRCHTSPQSIGYAFARHAETLGIPAIDSATAIRHCSNKVFMAERLQLHGLQTPRTLMASRSTTSETIEAALTYPMVLKVPDGSFSKSVAKVDNRPALELVRAEMLNRAHLVLVQDFMPTDFDWRIGVLQGEPIFACKYQMVRGHWQILKHREGRRPIEGPFEAVPASATPADVIETAVAASRAMGDGFHGVDLKATPDGVMVIEVNDNPDLNHGVEDQAEGEWPWLALLKWFGLAQLKRRETIMARSAASDPVVPGRPAPAALAQLRRTG